jgi:hypothetical protein
LGPDSLIRMNETDAVFVTDAVQVEFLQGRTDASLEHCWKIPMSLQAYGLLLRRGFSRVRAYVDFVDFEECKHWYLDTGLRYAQTWLSELGLRFEVEGIDFAALDAPCQFLLFTHLRFVERTAERIVQAMPGIGRFYVIQSRDLLQHEFYFDSDVAAAVLRAVCERLGRCIEVIEMKERPGYVHPQFQARPITSSILTRNKLPALNMGRGRVGFAPATVANAESIYESLRDVTSQTFLFPSTWDPMTFSSQDDWFSLSAADGDWSERIAGQLENLCKDFCERRVGSTLSDSIIRNPYLTFQFEYIIRRRWLAYANMIHHGKQLVRDLPLDLFIHSDVFTAEGAVLSRLYRRKGTKILISLHSSYPCDLNWASWERSDQAMAPSKSASVRLRQISGMKNIFRTGNRNLRGYRSLRPVGGKQGAADDRKILLVITNALELNCVPFVDLKAHFEAMSVLAEIADSLKDKVLFALRTKPGWPGEDPILYEHLSGFFPESFILSKTASFSESIQIADCIVGVNVPTGGYYEILQRGAPLIHFQTADVVSLQPDLPSDAIVTVTNAEALRSIIGSILFDYEYRDAAVRRQRTFAARDLESDYPGADDPVRMIVQKLVPKRLIESWRSRRVVPREWESEASPDTPLDINALRISSVGGAGSVDDILYRPNRHWKVIGWAGDLSSAQAAKAVHLFVNERWIARGVPAHDRPDVAAAYGEPRLLTTGFSVKFRLTNTELIDTLRVYAELTDRMFHLLPKSF